MPTVERDAPLLPRNDAASQPCGEGLGYTLVQHAGLARSMLVRHCVAGGPSTAVGVRGTSSRLDSRGRVANLSRQVISASLMHLSRHHL